MEKEIISRCAYLSPWPRFWFNLSVLYSDINAGPNLTNWLTSSTVFSILNIHQQLEYLVMFFFLLLLRINILYDSQWTQYFVGFCFVSFVYIWWFRVKTFHYHSLFYQLQIWFLSANSPSYFHANYLYLLHSACPQVSLRSPS